MFTPPILHTKRLWHSPAFFPARLQYPLCIDLMSWAFHRLPLSVTPFRLARHGDYITQSSLLEYLIYINGSHLV